ncbi:MAG: hypothetical protein R3Y40_04095 [Eubacteriales bacterium]
MKQAIVGFGLFIIVILVVSSVMALGKENTEQNTFVQSVELAVYQSLEEAMAINEDPGQLFEVNLNKLVDADLTEITIHESDYDKGILSVTVEKTYNNFGQERCLSVTRTVIYEREVADNELKEGVNDYESVS